MAFDFNYGNSTINSSGGFIPTKKNAPTNPREVVDTYADIANIPNPYVGLTVTVKADETNNNKMTDYKVISLKSNNLGIADMLIDQVQRMDEYLGVSSSGSGTGGAGLTTEQEERLNKIPEMEASINNINESLNTKANTSDIPTNTSELYNDSGFLTSIPSEYVTETEMNEAIANISSGGSVDLSGNIFKNKVANFLGDSQTEVNYHKNKIYCDWVKEILGLSKVNNYGISGTTIAKKNSSDNTAMCVRYANMDNNADLICVMGGVNDRWFNCQMGSFGDTDPITFYGAMETICDGLLTKYPGKTIIFITPTEQNNNSCNSANRTGYTPTDFSNAMKRVCAKYSIPVFDANTCSGIYPLNQANASLYTTDRLHLNNKGHEVLGNKLSKFILNGANVVMINNDSGGGSTSDIYGNIVISKSTVSINEGSRDTFTVKLDKAPTNSQIVNISSNNSDVTLSTNTLTFDSSNYLESQTVTINVAEDSDAVNDNCTLTLSSNNVSSKTITIRITDNDSTSDVPIENQFVGKTVTVTKNYQGNFAHITALLNVDEDMRSDSTYNIILKGSNVSNMSNTSNSGGTLFSDNSGEVENGLGNPITSTSSRFTQTVSNGNLTVTVPQRNTAISSNYVKVPIIISGSLPYSFRIDEIKIIVNNVERNILKLGAFFDSNKEIITITDNESASDTYGNIVVSKSTATISEGGTDTFTVKLDKAPTNSQTVNISSNNSDVTLSTNTLTFTPDNYNQTQEVRINVAEDSDTVNDNCTLTISSSNVSSKTITITITDNDSPSDVPIENQFIGKTVTVTKNFQGSFAHLTALLNVDEDMRSNSTYSFVLSGSNTSNMSNASNNGGELFNDNSGDVANGQFVNQFAHTVQFTQTVSNGNLTITAPSRSGVASSNYVKVPIVISGTVPYSFRINEIKIIVNNVERNILKLGAFFASEREALTVE